MTMYIIVEVVDENCLFAAKNPVVHYDEVAARKECERLSRANPGLVFMYFKSIAKCCVQDVLWSV